jgi:excisionase family DNA binding protein
MLNGNQQRNSASRVGRQTCSVEETAVFLGIGRTLAYELIRRGEFPLPVIRLGRRIVVPRAALDDLLRLDVSPESPGPGEDA